MHFKLFMSSSSDCLYTAEAVLGCVWTVEEPGIVAGTGDGRPWVGGIPGVAEEDE